MKVFLFQIIQNSRLNYRKGQILSFEPFVSIRGIWFSNKRESLKLEINYKKFRVEENCLFKENAWDDKGIRSSFRCHEVE